MGRHTVTKLLAEEKRGGGLVDRQEIFRCSCGAELLDWSEVAHHLAAVLRRGE